MKYEPQIFKSYPSLIAIESNRLDGGSIAPFSSLNVGLNTEDHPDHVAANRKILFDSVGISLSQVAYCHQIHSDKITIVQNGGCQKGFDALITNTPNVFLSITVADCTPILLFDPIHNVVAAIHAGWKGTALQITRKTIGRMKLDFGTDSKQLLAFVGTSISAAAYEVGEEVAQQFNPAFYYPNLNGRFQLDVAGANIQQLIDEGLELRNIEKSSFCTSNDNHLYFSYRKEGGQTGRFMVLVGWR